mmetsp:Transcript_112203/g.257111  ORF Transcript_112203/g.257111 Transcript_112203/m.257111 type:complete len:220 (-) Transcript_112203:549-1208(-)
MDALLNPGVDGQGVRVPDLNMDRVVPKVVGHPLRCLGPCGSEHDHLPLLCGRKLTEDRVNLVAESFLQHEVSLVQHHKMGLGRPENTLLHKIKHPPRRPHHDVWILLQRISLRIQRTRPSAGYGAGDPRGEAEADPLGVDLVAELPGRGQYQGGGPVGHHVNARVALDGNHDGEQVGQGLARPGLSDAHQVQTQHGQRPRNTLDLSGALEHSDVRHIVE